MQVQKVAQAFNAEPQRVKALYRINAEQLRAMASKAAASKTGKHNGYTETQLVAKAVQFEALSK